MLWQYLNTDFNTDASSSSSTVGTLVQRNPQKVKAFSTVIFRYKLLDVLANLLNVPQHPSLPVAKKHAFVDLSGRLSEVSTIMEIPSPL